MDELNLVRDEEKKKVFLKGLLLKIKDELRPRMPKDCVYKTLCELAFVAANCQMCSIKSFYNAVWRMEEVRETKSEGRKGNKWCVDSLGRPIG